MSLPQRLRRARIDQPGWELLVLRAFLGLVYLYAGISKIADRSFLDSSSPTSIHANVVAVKSASPIGGLLGPVVDHSFAFGLLMALGELAVGVGILLGLLTRIAAVGGMVLAFSLWMTVSWQASPWYTSADLVYLFAFTPLLLGGARLLSLDAWLASVRGRHPGVSEDRTRRALVIGGAGVLAAALAGLSTAFRQKPQRTAAPSLSATAGSPTAGGSTAASSGGSLTPSASGQPPATGPVLTAVSEVAVGGGKQVTEPKSGEPCWVLQLTQGQFTAYDAICPHQGCTVSFVSSSEGFVCPCHDSHFSATGARVSGPAPRGLAPVEVRSDGTNIHLA